MSKTMFKLSTLALLSALSLSAPAFADDTPAGIASDVGAVQKDNADIAKHDANLAKHRARKANHKTNGDWTGQASDSVAIGADKAMKSEKGVEKDTDKKILRHDVDDATGQ